MEFLTQFIGHFAHSVAKAASVPHKLGTIGITQFTAGSSRGRGKVFEQIARNNIVQLIRQADRFAEMFGVFRGGRTGKGFDQINGFASVQLVLAASIHYLCSQNYSGMSNIYYKELCQGI